MRARHAELAMADSNREQFSRPGVWWRCKRLGRWDLQGLRPEAFV